MKGLKGEPGLNMPGGGGPRIGPPRPIGILPRIICPLENTWYLCSVEYQHDKTYNKQFQHMALSIPD